MKALMNQLRESAVKAILNADSPENLEALRVKYLGKKGELTAILKQMGKLSAEERPVMGQLANQIRAELESAIDETRKKLEAAALEARLELETVDVTVPGEDIRFGHKHPMYKALDEIKEIFVGMGFTVLDGPEVELATYNFDKLNAEEGHPSRDWSDTFYFDKDSRVMLRSQTSPMQVRAMETMKLPIRIVAPGRVYRKDEVDARNAADQVIYQSEKTLNEMGDKVTESDKAPVLAAIEKLKEAQKGTDVAAIKAATDEVQKAFYSVSEKLYKNAAPQGDPNANCGGDCGGCGPQDGNKPGDDGVVDADYEEV